MAKKPWNELHNIPMSETHYEKRGGRWVIVSEKRRLASMDEHRNITNKDTLSFFRRLGGYERNDKDYTARGYAVVQNTSISPDRTQKIVRKFDMDNVAYLNAQRKRRYK